MGKGVSGLVHTEQHNILIVKARIMLLETRCLFILPVGYDMFKRDRQPVSQGRTRYPQGRTFCNDRRQEDFE